MGNARDNVEDYFSRTSREFANLYRTRPDFRDRFATWSDVLDRYSSGASTALDVGCGNGTFSFYLADKGLQVTGVDAADQMIALCESEKAARGIQGINFVNAKVPGNGALVVPAPVDLVISSSMLEYVDDLGAALDFICSRVRKSGIVIVSLPNPKAVFRRLEQWSYTILGRPAYRAYVKQLVSWQVLAGMFAQRGCAAVETRYYAHAPLLSRTLRTLRLPAEYTENLYISVFRKDT